MGVNSPLTEHNGTRRHSGSLGDIVSSGLHSPCRRIERLHCARPAEWMEGGSRGERQRKREQCVCLSVSAEGARGRGNRGRRRWGRGGGVGGCSAPWHWTCLFQTKQTKRYCAINITQAAECRAKEALKGVGTQTWQGNKCSRSLCCFGVAFC